MCRVLFFNHKPTEQSESERRMLRAVDATYMSDPCLESHDWWSMLNTVVANAG